MYWLKACSKCGGDLHEAQDQFGRYVACLQCGRYFLEEQPARHKGVTFPETAGNPAVEAVEKVAA